MTVRYVHEGDQSYGNIMWPAQFNAQARNGWFPPGHPVAAGSSVFGLADMQLGDGAKLAEFRARGYWASCFPEGDGITMRTKNGQSAEQVKRDIADVFGWEVLP